MKLVKIYANSSRFKPILFNEGFNIVYGDVEKEVDQSTGKVQEHNIGKTSLVYLIDFLLLKGVKKKNFFGKHKVKFSDWIFFLEIKLNNGEFLTIRRAVNPNTKISFKGHRLKNQDFTQEEHWDYADLSMNAKDKKKNPKHVLENKYLQYDVNAEFRYRSCLPYLLRTQDDYQEVFELSKFRGKHKDWKPALFNLLGYNATLLKDKYELDMEIDEEKKHIKKIQDKHDSSGEIYKIKAAIEAKEIEKKEIEEEVDRFDFYQKEKDINFDLVKNVENEIAKLNKERYVLSHNIEQIQQSLESENKPSLKISEIEQLFDEVKLYFPDNLSKEYQDVLDFSSQLTQEREKHLKEELLELQANIDKVIGRLQTCNKERGEMLSVLKEKDTFVKYKKFQDDLVKIENEIYSYKQTLDGAKTIDNYQKSITKINDKIKNLTVLIKQEIDKGNPDEKEIKRIFQKYIKTTFEFTALLVVEPNKVGNANFDTVVLNKSQDLTGKGDGHTSTKILCASFVLAVLIHYSVKSFFRFAYHDGITESWGDNHKIHFINLVRSFCEESGVQYTVSLIKSDIPQRFQIQEGEIIRTLGKEDQLFGFEF